MSLASTVFLCLCLICCISGRDVPAPKYIVDLDLPPEDRWAQVAKDYSAYFPILQAALEKYVPKVFVNAITDVTSRLDKYFPYPYADELKGFVKHSGNNVTLGEIVLGNVIYDITAFNKYIIRQEGRACTSIVASDTNGTIYHGRNLDYHFFRSILTAMTIVVQFKKGDNPNVFTGTTFAGFIGFLTGCKEGAISVSLNERDKGQWWENAIDAVKEGGNGLVTLLIRDVLQKDQINFNEAVSILSNTPLITPSYIIVAGTAPASGVVITRDRDKAIDKMFLDPDNGSWFVLETNYDHWKNPPRSDDRRDPGIKDMNAIGHSGINAASLYKVLSTEPVLNSATTYTTVMSPMVPGLYTTILRNYSSTK